VLVFSADGKMLTENCPVGFHAAILRASHLAAAALAALVAIAPAKAYPIPAQSGSSSIRMQSAQQGLTLQVRDISGAVIPGTSVSLANTESGVRWDLTTDSNGELALLDLPPGSYDIVITHAGFSSFVEKNLTVPGHAAITLQIGALMGEVVMVGAGPEPEPTSSEISAVLVEPSSVTPDVPTKPQDHRNALQKFFRSCIVSSKVVASPSLIGDS
jgi:hypothetical protein